MRDCSKYDSDNRSEYIEKHKKEILARMKKASGDSVKKKSVKKNKKT